MQRLQSNGASVWFSEKDVPLGKQLIREIDKGLKNSRVGIVLVTPALLKSIEAEGIAEKELSVLLASGPGHSRRARDHLRGTARCQPDARVACRTEHRRIVAGGRGRQGRRRRSGLSRRRGLTRRHLRSNRDPGGAR